MSSKFDVTFNILGAFTIPVDSDDETEAYQDAVKAFFDAMDTAGIKYELERRNLEAIEEVEETPAPKAG